MLPYVSIEEAQAALGGRELTWLETWWFHTTSNVPDEVIFRWTAAVVIATVHLAGLALLAVDKGMLGSKFAARYKIQPSEHLDGPTLRRVYVGVVAMYVGVIVPMILLSYPIFKAAGLRMSFPLPTVWEVAAQVVVYFLVEDFGNYWIHRWLHSPWMYHKIHCVHHSIKAPGSFAAIYTHPLDSVMQGIPALFGMILVPPHVITLWIWMFLAILHGFEVHSGYYFPTPATLFIPFWGGAEFHDYHHSHGGRPNASNFSNGLWIFDYIYGTDKGYWYFRRFKQAKKNHQENLHHKIM